MKIENMSDILLLMLGNLALLCWIGILLVKIRANTNELVNLAHDLVQMTSRKSSSDDAPINPQDLHEGMTPAKLVTAIEQIGGKLRLVDDVMGSEVVLDNPKTAGPKAAELVKAKNKALVQLLRARSR